jgi:hypothetical protein
MPSPPESDHRLVLVVAESLDSLELLNDAVTLVGSDPRITVSATVSPHLAQGAASADLGWPILPWPQATQQQVGLVLTTDEAQKVAAQFAAPVVVLSSQPVPMEPPRVRARVHQHVGAPQADTSGEVVVDPRWERMLAATGRRDRYRDALRAGERRLIVVSTHPERSDFIRQQETVQELLGILPLDHYTVAVSPDPALWWSPRGACATGEGDVSLLMDDLVEAGVGLIPPQGRRAAMIAADVILGEPASTRYAAALGTPAFALAPSPPRYTSAPSWDLVEAIATAPLPSRGELPAPQTSGAQRLRRLFYRCIDLPEPEKEAYYTPLPDVPACAREVTAWRITGAAWPDPVVRRFPAATPPPHPGTLPLVVDVDDGHLLRQDNASGWCRRRELLRWEAQTWASSMFTKYPMARVVASPVEGGVLVVHRDGPDEGALVPHTAHRVQDASMVAAHALIAASFSKSAPSA